MSALSDSMITFDGLNLFTQKWIASNEKARLLIVHGYGEHSSRYNHLAEFLNKNDTSVYSFDQRGYGKSDGLSGYVSRISDYLKDIDQQLKAIFKDDVPMFIFGHSMGGLLVTKYCLDYKPQVNGVLLSGPGLKVSEDVNPNLQKLAGILGTLLPKLKTQGLDHKAISRDAAVVKKYEDDPLIIHHGMRARTGKVLLSESKSIAKDFFKFNLPVFIMHGTGDRLTDIDGSRQLYKDAVSSDKEIKEYDGLYHELINEPEKEVVMQDILNWITNRI